MNIKEFFELQDKATDAKLAKENQQYGMRHNVGKPRLELVPFCYIARQTHNEFVSEVFDRLFYFQMRGIKDALKDALLIVQKHTSWSEVANVLEFGAKKYELWNWEKGMQWTIPLGCIARHLMQIEIGEENDKESGLSHWAHVLTNLMMLDCFIQKYPQLNDLCWAEEPPIQHQSV